MMADRLGTSQFLDQRLVHRHSLWEVGTGKKLSDYRLFQRTTLKFVCVKKQLTFKPYHQHALPVTPAYF